MAYPYVDFHQPPTKGKNKCKGANNSEPRNSSRSREVSFGSPDLHQQHQRSVTFKFKEMLEQERPALASSSAFPLTWLPATTDYLVISDDDDGEGSDCDTQQPKHNNNNTMAQVEGQSPHVNPIVKNTNTTTTIRQQRTQADDAEQEEIFKIERSFKEKLSHLTKDLGNLLSQPSHNLREFLRRREGYAPPEKSRDTRLCNDEDDSNNQR